MIGLIEPVAVAPPGFAVTVYDEIVAPPLEAGAVNVTVACALPAVADTPVGAPGGPIGVTGADAAEADPGPAELVAVTLKV